MNTTHAEENKLDPEWELLNPCIMVETPLQNISTVYGMGRSRRQHFGRFKPMRTRNLSNIVKSPITKTHSPRTEFVPKIMLTNVMSLVPKLDELRILISAQSFDLGFITETWLRESVCDTHATLFDYHLVRRDRSLGIYGGVCMYIHKEFHPFQTIT